MGHVCELMDRSLLAVEPGGDAAEAARLATEKHVSHLLVLERDELVGIVGTQALQAAAPGARVFDCMRSPAPRIRPTASIEEALDLMQRSGLGCLAVAAGGLLLGVFSPDRVQALAVPA